MTSDNVTLLSNENSVGLTMPKVSSLNAAQAYLLSLNSENSRSTMRSNLNKIAHLLGSFNLNNCPWHQINRDYVLGVIEALKSEKLESATINTYIAAIKGVAQELWLSKKITTENYQLIKHIKQIKGSRLAKGRALSSHEIQLLFSSCNDQSIKGIRDSAILGVLLGCGLRRSEIVDCSIGSFNAEEGALRVLGKGNKERMCYLPQQSLTLLDLWLTTVSGDNERALFTRIRRFDTVTDDKLTSQAILHILNERRKQAGVNAFSPHDCRRTFASMLLDNGEDISTVKDAMGHASIITTQKYDKRGFERLKKASANLSFM
ncbi:tyrosine-type recombinase/integrase [Aliivibrio sp. S3MY1]|uniref:tyrosine-type recombinase/integrase n=3 Tax=unclassified Aliivibrio TaxID=2645654 RepID=UPI002378A1D1|nr:tyrosine-type recombinase/integrase [Aliivibrio sp. S3MY1]MDD9197516.1 tyrosine-type recombinase/integrase [Aliivibrio sp. S3MY1]